MITPEEYKRIYRMLDEVSPAPFDCGSVCGEACCSEVAEDDGIYLLPGEECIHSDDEWLNKEKIGELFFVKCKGPENCNRSLRPIQCRTFPLMPSLDAKGELEMKPNDIELSFSCPLINAGTRLQEDFVRVTTEAWELLVRDEAVRRICKG